MAPGEKRVCRQNWFVVPFVRGEAIMSHRVLIVGVGSIGERHLRCFLQTQRANLWVCEPNEELRHRIEDTYKLERSSASLEELLTDPPDAAVICTPSPIHVPLAIQLTNAGVHLLIEKPLSTSMQGVDELTATARQQKTTIAIAYVFRSNPSISAMREALQSGRFGEPRQLVFASGQYFPFYRPAYRDIYYASRETGGGAIQDALTHGINAAEWLIGPMTEVAADAGHQVLEGVDVEDTAHVIARHDRVMASYSLNQYQAPNETSFTIVCESGTLRCQLHCARWEWQISPEDHWNEGGQYPLERDEMFVRQANMFLDAIEQKRRPLCTLNEGIQTLRANLAILQSVDDRSWQKIEKVI